LGFGQTGVVLAELLGLPHSTIIMQVEVNGPKLRVKRELEDGWFQHIEMPLPAVLTIQSGINKLRYATLMGIKKARAKEIRRVTAAELGAAPASSARIEKIYPPEKNKQARIFEGDAKTAAAQLAEKLKFEARVL
jgi:electron transfer flavoprotein beta subunit